jgi:hypothetical protein
MYDAPTNSPDFLLVFVVDIAILAHSWKRPIVMLNKDGSKGASAWAVYRDERRVTSLYFFRRVYIADAVLAAYKTVLGSMNAR